MRPGGRYNEVDVAYETESFSLRFEAEWDDPQTALFGPSGSGKSTLLEVIAGVRQGAAGRVILDGRTIFDTDRGASPAPQKRWVGWVPQDACLFPHLSVRENVRFGLGRGGAEGEKRLEAAIALLELGELLDRRASQLSGGERQRAAVARAIASGARVLLLDEPLASLDRPLRSRVFPLFLRLRDELRLPMIYVTHDADEALALAPHVLVIDGGKCAGAGAAATLLGESAGAGSFALHNTKNRFTVVLRERCPQDGTAVLELPSGLRLTMSATPLPSRPSFDIGIREEEIILAQAPPGLLSAQNVLQGTVLSILEREGLAWVTAEVSGTRFVSRVTRRALEALRLAPGRSVCLVFKASSLQALTRTDRPPGGEFR